MARYRLIKITALIYTMIICVLFLLPEEYNLSYLLFHKRNDLSYYDSEYAKDNSDFLEKSENESEGEIEGEEMTEDPDVEPTASPEPSPTPFPTYYPEDYFKKNTTPYVGTGSAPSYKRESHHYDVNLKFPSDYKVENTLYFKVEINAQLVRVYRRDSNGNPTRLVRTMIMSSGAGSNATPLGRFMIMENSVTGTAKTRWKKFTQDWAQYATRLFYIKSESSTGMTGYYTGFLFHTELYRAADPTRLIVDEFNTLGYPRSHGCLRLQVKDAKWIYDNAKAGSIVEIVNGTPDPATWAALKPDLLPAGTLYDPTDPLKPGNSSEAKLDFSVPATTVAPTEKPAVTPVPTATPTAAPVVTPTTSPDNTPELTPESTQTPAPTVTPTPTPPPEPTPTPTPSPGV